MFYYGFIYNSDKLTFQKFMKPMTNISEISEMGSTLFSTSCLGCHMVYYCAIDSSDMLTFHNFLKPMTNIS